MKKLSADKAKYLLLMCSFGLLGPIVRAINMPTPLITLLRAWISTITLILYAILSKKKFDKQEIKKLLVPLIIGGFFMAGDWLFLFEAYNYTTVAISTVVYYLAPIFMIIAAPFVLKEKLTIRHLLCIIVAFIGIVFISGTIENGLPSAGELVGIGLALLGALFYTGILIFSKRFFTKIEPIIVCIFELGIAGIIMIPYVLLTTDLSGITVTPLSASLLLFLSIGMTGFAYIVYYSLAPRIPARTVAIFSYGDPTVAVIASTLFMHEPISISGMIGAVLVIGAAIIAEFI